MSGIQKRSQGRKIYFFTIKPFNEQPFEQSVGRKENFNFPITNRYPFMPLKSLDNGIDFKNSTLLTIMSPPLNELLSIKDKF